MKQRHFAITFLVMVIAVLTGFVVNTKQTPTRWQYLRYEGSVSADDRPYFRMDGPLDVVASGTVGGAGFESVAEPVGCSAAYNVVALLNCLGDSGWELATHVHHRGRSGTAVVEVITLKRPVEGVR